MAEARGARSVCLDSGGSSAFRARDCRAGVLDLLRDAHRQTVPGNVAGSSQAGHGHLLERYSGIGNRLDRLFKVVFSTTYRADLSELGYGNVAALLKRVEGCRNRFVHGEPEAIDDSLVEALVGGLKDEHEGWIAVFNRRLKEARYPSGEYRGT